MIVKVAEPKGQDSFARLASYIKRELEEAGAKVGKRSRDDFATLARYMTRDDDFRALATNCGVDPEDIDKATEIIRATQRCNTRAKKKSMHLIVSFPAGERPDETQLAYIEKRLLESIGMNELQRIRVVHTDTDHLHMHIAVNRIHPEKHTSVQPTRDFKALSKRARELEIELGLQRVMGRDAANPDLELQTRLREEKETLRELIDRAESWETLQESLIPLDAVIERRRSGAVFASRSKDARVALSAVDPSFTRGSLEARFGELPESQRSQEKRHESRTRSDAAVKHERHQGTQSFQSWILERREEIVQDVLNAPTWQAAHDALAKRDLAFSPYRSGLTVINLNGSGAIAASQLDRSLSKRTLESHLGAFEADRESERNSNGAGYDSHPLGADSDLHQQFLRDRQVWLERRQAERRRQREIADKEYQAHRKRYQDEANSIKRNPFFTASDKRRAFKRLQKRRRRDYEKLKERSNLRRANKVSIPSYRQWLLERAMRGRADAMRELRRMFSSLGARKQWTQAMSGSVRADGESQRKDRTRTRERPNAVFEDGSSEVQRQKLPMVVEGDRLHVAKDDLASVKIFLEEAVERFQSPLDIQGSESFLASAVICAASMDGVRFSNRDLQSKVNVLRENGRDQRDVELQAEMPNRGR